MSATRSRHSAAGSPPDADADARRALARELEEVTAAAKASWEVVQPIAAREGEIPSSRGGGGVRIRRAPVARRRPLYTGYGRRQGVLRACPARVRRRGEVWRRAGRR